MEILVVDMGDVVIEVEVEVALGEFATMKEVSRQENKTA